ncbi:MAG: hypothetical protein ACKVZH_24275 [Blastocatellia bacterium]
MPNKTLSNPKRLHRIYGLFFLALTLFYLSLTPGTIEGQGYNRENLVAANQIVANVFNAPTGQSLVPVEWTRHGFIEPLFHLPFAVVGRALPGDAVKLTGRMAVLQPILATSLLCTLLLIWAHRLTTSLRLAMLLAISAGLGTMLWPYAYIGLETTQSLALLIAAYFTLGRKPTRSWPEALLVGAACAVAVAVKLNGVFLAPAVAFLLLEYFGLQNIFHRRGAENAENAEAAQRKASRLKLIGVLAIIVTVYALNHLAKSRYWNGMDAGVNYFRDILADSPLTAALQAFAYFGSPNKSLLLFCPVLVLSFLTLGSAWRHQPLLVIFALLTLSGLIGGFSITRMWADETWGPRYLHAAIAPLMLCLAAAKPATEFHWRRESPMVALLVIGFAVSLLGSLFPYVALHNAATNSSQATLEALQYDPKWNHIRFNWQLTKVWLKDSPQPENWPPPKHWWFTKPEDAPPETFVDLRELALPQPILAQRWRAATPTSFGVFSTLRGLCSVLLAVGIAGLILAWRRANLIESELQKL